MTERRICVLGGCGGIGRGIVSACLANGDDVVVLDLKTSLTRHPPPAGVVAVEIDGSDEASVTNAFAKVAERWAALDGFVNAAGFLIALQPLAQTPGDEFDLTIEGNVRTAFLCCKAAMTLLEKGEAPSLVNLASGLGGFIRPEYGPYAASKAAIIALTQDAGARARAASARQRRCARSSRHRHSCAAVPDGRKNAILRLSTSPLTARRYHYVA